MKTKFIIVFVGLVYLMLIPIAFAGYGVTEESLCGFGGGIGGGYIPPSADYNSDGSGAIEKPQSGESDHEGYKHNVSMDDVEATIAGQDDYHHSLEFYHGDVPASHVRVRLKNKTNHKIGKEDVEIGWYVSPNKTFNPDYDTRIATDHNRESIGEFEHNSHDDELVERKTNITYLQDLGPGVYYIYPVFYYNGEENVASKKDTGEYIKVTIWPKYDVEALNCNPDKYQVVVGEGFIIEGKISNNYQKLPHDVRMGFYISGGGFNDKLFAAKVFTADELVGQQIHKTSVFAPLAAGEYTITMKVDDEYKLSEVNEDNNQQSFDLWVMEDVTGPEYDLESFYLTSNKYEAEAGGSLVVEGKIGNNLDKLPHDVSVKIHYQNGGIDSGTLFETVFTPDELGQQTFSTTITLPNINNDYSIVLWVDSGREIKETTEKNNRQSFKIHIVDKPVEPVVKYDVEAVQITSDKYTLIIDESFVMSGVLGSNFDKLPSDVVVSFYFSNKGCADAWWFDTTVVASELGQKTLVFNARASVATGNYVVKMKVDANNSIPEVDEWNNQQSFDLVVKDKIIETETGYDVEAVFLVSDKYKTVIDEEFIIKGKIRSNLNKLPCDIDVGFYLSGNGFDNELLYTRTFTPDELGEYVFELDAVADVDIGLYTITMKVDVNDYVIEVDEWNNQQSFELVVTEEEGFNTLDFYMMSILPGIISQRNKQE